MTTRRGLLIAPKKIPDKGLMESRGTVAYLASLSKQYSVLPFSRLRDWIDPALMANQLIIFYKWNDGSPVGYITWALLAPDVEQRWIHEAEASLHPSEWNEGETLWIMDFLALPGYCEDIVEYVDQNLFAGHSKAFALRKGRAGLARRVACWKRRNGTVYPDAASTLEFRQMEA